jgi:hypothetical protein
VKAMRVSQHAFEQAVRRFPAEFGGLGHAAVCRAVVAEVCAAVDEGRMAQNMPRWAVRAGCSRRYDVTRYRGRRHPATRVVWTADERRLYIVSRRPGLTVVLTTILPDVAGGAAAVSA